MKITGYLNQDPDRPTQVRYAVFLLYVFLAGSFLIYLVQTAVSFFVRPAGVSAGTIIFSFVIMVLLYLVMYFVATKIAAGKNWARWLLLAGFAVMMVLTTLNLPVLVLGDVVPGLLVLVQVLVTAVAVALLFQRPCNEWFGSGEYYEQNDIQFDA